MKNHQKHQNYKIYKIKSYKPQETFQNKWELILNSKLKVKKTFRKQQKLLNECLNGGICPKSGIGHGHNLMQVILSLSEGNMTLDYFFIHFLMKFS